MKYIYLYIISFVIFLAIDFVWLNFIAKNLYSTKIGHLLAEKPVLPGYEAQNIWETVMLGALFGLLTYSTYDLTNLATLKNWPVSVTIIDLIWGTSISTTVSVAGYYAARMLGV